MDLFKNKYFNSKLIFISIYNEEFGMGHIKRSLTINNKVNNKNHLITIGDKYETNDFSSNHNVKINNLNKIIKIISKFQINNKTFLVLDISNSYFYKIVNSSKIISIFKNIKETKIKIILIDSIEKESFFLKYKLSVNYLIIPYSFNNHKKYKKFNLCKNYFFSQKYFIYSNKMILLRKKTSIKNIVKTCLISFGGTDMTKTIYLILAKLCKSNPKINFITNFKINKKLQYHKKIIKLSKNFKNIKIKNLQNDFSEIIYKSDIIISSSGLTKYESSFLGKPVIRIYRNINEKKIDQHFKKINLTNSFMYNELDKFQTYFKKLSNNYNIRKKIFNKCIGSTKI